MGSEPRRVRVQCGGAHAPPFAHNAHSCVGHARPPPLQSPASPVQVRALGFFAVGQFAKVALPEIVSSASS